MKLPNFTRPLYVARENSRFSSLFFAGGSLLCPRPPLLLSKHATQAKLAAKSEEKRLLNKTQKVSFSFSKLWYGPLGFNRENFANIWQIKWNWIISMKFETVRIYFFSEFSFCCHRKILQPWQRDVTTSAQSRTHSLQDFWSARADKKAWRVWVRDCWRLYFNFTGKAIPQHCTTITETLPCSICFRSSNKNIVWVVWMHLWDRFK